MKKFVKDLTLKEYRRYSNLRAADSNWDLGMAITTYTFLSDLPKRKFLENRITYNNRCEQYFQENLSLLWNIEAYPNMKIDIETGEIELE